MVPSNIKTQKARGIYAAATEMSALTNNGYGVSMPTNVTVILSDGIIGSPVRNFPLFARPCPIRPRHGFVESRLVRGFDDLSQVWREARAADSEAELVLMPALTGLVSSVATGSGIAWGKGNAGATSGSGAKYVPCPENSTTKWKSVARFQSDIGIKTCPYAEIVEHRESALLVQLRDGPALPSAVNFVPAVSQGMIVERVLTLADMPCSEDDAAALLYWESVVANAAATPGLVIYLPGKTLGSHFAVHGIASSLPVVCEGKVEVGKPLDVASDVAPLRPKELQRIGRMMFDARETPMPQDADLAKQAVATLHALGTWGSEGHLLALRAEMPVILARYISAACLGELRHWFQRCGPGWHDRPLKTEMPTPVVTVKGGSHPGRDRVYLEAFKLPWPELAPRMRTAREDFNNGGWNGNYGGRPWAQCARAAFYISVAIDSFIKKPTELKYAKLLKACNVGVNVAHNGGKVLTKWLASSTMDDLSKLPVLGFLSSTVGQKIVSID